MQKVNKKLSELVQPEKNVRIHTEKQLLEFEKSVKMFGQLRPIVIDEKNTILAGNGLFETLRRMKWETAECYQYTDLTENQKKKLMIADNKIFSLGIENLDTLNDFLEELQGDLEIPGFDEEILKQMVSDATEVTEKIAEYGALGEEEIRNIKENNEKREQRASESFAGTSTTQILVVESQKPTNTPPENESTAEVRRFVICPECGGKVWL